ncbi:C40 family peptidase [Paraclostridium bifermentans]|uniref:C40 family peptidase n=1 Tax=Paraclostridium bifermentans TaxID=1490 RepID=UPI00359C937D
MKRKILVPVFASFMALSMNGVAHADDAKTEKVTDKKDTKEVNEKSIIDLANFKDVDYKVATVKDGVAVKIRKQGSVQTVAYEGDSFRIVGEQDGWYKIQLDDESEGWVASRFVDVDNAHGYVTADKVNLREKATTESEVKDELDASTKVKVLETKDNWVKVKSGDKEGYIRDLYVSDKAPVVEEETQTDDQTQNDVQESTVDQTQNNVQESTNDQAQNDVQESTNDQNNTQESTESEDNSSDVVNNNNSNTNNNNNNNQSSNNNNSSSNEEAKPEEKPAPPTSNTNAASAVVNLAYSKLGSPYVWGAEGPNSFDCSGLTSYVYRNAAGISLPRTSGSQYGVGRSVSKANLQAGDLVFFATGGGGISHVGIYVGGGNMIHAPQAGDVVKVSNINSSYWQNAYVGAKRVL